jgi:hypothetical protein
MEDNTFAINYDSDLSDETIHKFAASYLLSKYDPELVLTQGDFAYLVKGGKSGHLYYRKRNGEWILIANWCFYGLYIVVRYRKPAWLRPMYMNLFNKMHFTSVKFDDYSIELSGSDGVLRSRRFRLTPPSAFDKVMLEQFGFSEEKIRRLKTELGLD